MNKKPSLIVFCRLIILAFLLVQCISAQTLTVRDIMAEPSIAGMRVEGEKLSPDGTKVVYLWNAEGKMPRDLYLVSTSGGTPSVILRNSDLPVPTRTPQPESKLNYGVEIRDEFVKAREDQLGGFEWSPDSKKLVFSYGGDVYVLDLETEFTGDQAARVQSKWADYAAGMIRRANLVPSLIKSMQDAGIQETELYRQLSDAQIRLLSLLTVTANGSKTLQERQSAIASDNALTNQLDRIRSLTENYPVLKQNENFMKQTDEILGVENRINVARMDFKEAVRKDNPKRFTKTQSPESGARFLDNERILFSQSGNAFVLNMADSTITQITKEANQQNFVSVGSITPNKAGTLVAYVVSDGSKQRALVVPNYLPEFVGANNPRRGWSEQKLFVTPADGSRDTPFEIKLPKPEGVSNFRRMVWTADGRSLIVDRVDKDTKRRQLYYVHNVGSKAEQIILVTEETDDKWQASLSVIFEPNPKDPSQLFFGSERDGFNHLYLAKLEQLKPEPNPTGVIRGEGDPGYSSNVAITHMTKGNWQVEWAKWVDGKILFNSTQKSTVSREFYVADPVDGSISIFATGDEAMRVNPQVSIEGSPILLFDSSKWDGPSDLYTAAICKSCQPQVRRITNTVPVSFQRLTLTTITESSCSTRCWWRRATSS